MSSEIVLYMIGLSYTGKSCFVRPFVLGYKRDPEPPAKIIPFIYSSNFIRYAYQVFNSAIKNLYLNAHVDSYHLAHVYTMFD